MQQLACIGKDGHGEEAIRFAVADGGGDAARRVGGGGAPTGRRQVGRRRGRLRSWRPSSYHTVPQAAVPAATVRSMFPRRDQRPKQPFVLISLFRMLVSYFLNKVRDSSSVSTGCICMLVS